MFINIVQDEEENMVCSMIDLSTHDVLQFSLSEISFVIIKELLLFKLSLFYDTMTSYKYINVKRKTNDLQISSYRLYSPPTL